MRAAIITFLVIWALFAIAEGHRQRSAERRLNDSRIELLEQMGELDLPEHLEARRQALLNLVAPTPYRWRPVLVGLVALVALIGIATALWPSKDDADYPAQDAAINACYLKPRVSAITDAQLILCMRGMRFRFDESCDAGQPVHHPRCYRPAL